jgi:predicted phage terminase large subunit-like protein
MMLTTPPRERRVSRDQLDHDARMLARMDFQSFTKRMFPDYQPARFHFVIGDALELISHRANRYLAVIIPPQHGKSNLCSIHFPPWHLGNYPDQRFIACSYNGELAASFSRRARNILTDQAWPFDVRLDAESKSNTQWNIAGRRGGHRAAGVGGGITGMSADILLIDDPVKNQEEADSELNRENAWEWFTTTAWTRIAPDGAVVLIGTRWHEDDLIGRALNMPGIPWQVIHLPAQALEPEEEGMIDAAGRYPGAFLWPERYPPAEYEKRKEVLGTKGWTTLYQGMPYPAEGGMFKRDWWQTYDRERMPRLRKIIIAVDSAFKDGVSNDYSVFATWGVDFDGNFYLVDLWRDRVEFPDLISAGYGVFMKVMAYFRNRPGYPPTFLPALHVEDKASGQSAIQVWKKAFHDASGHKRPGLPVIPVKTGAASKISRAEGVSPMVEARRCFLPDVETDPWVSDFISEHAAFPAGKYDDMVDSTSMALGVLSKRTGSMVGGY